MEVQFDSEKDRGTRFEVYLPRIEGQVVTVEDATDIVKGSAQTILLVDDEPSIVDVVTDILEELNYRVTGYTDSQKSLDALKATPEKFDLVITDYAMPNMTGLDWAKKTVAIKSDIPIILCSGFSGAIDIDKAHKSGVTQIISKPIDIKEISVTIHNILSKGE
jgi:CheY-like chemotaxis protein